MKLLPCHLGVLCWLLISPLSAQPIPPSPDGEKAHYIFTVYTPQGQQEAPIWRTPNVALTTHQLINYQDSAAIRLRPVLQTALRTYVDLGADAGAMEVVNEPGSPTLQEVLSYDQLLSPEQRQLTESYLAIKYGLTLSQNLPTNYLAPQPDGNTLPVWTATAAAAFKHRIFGLAKDAASNLLCLRNASVLAPDLIALHWPTAPGERAYFMMADDGAPTARVATQDSVASIQLLQRRWRIETTGSTVPTRLSISPQKIFARVAKQERWVLQLTTPERQELFLGEAREDGKIDFELPTLAPGTAHFQLGLQCDDCAYRQVPTPDDFFQSVRVSPNPARAGHPIQLRAALQQSSGLVIIAYDALGREVLHQALPSNTHHLTELTLPAPGSYSLHLRSRLRHRNAPHYATKVLVQ